MFAALAKVEAITGQTPTLPVMRSDQKPPALTADALKLDGEVEPQADVKAVTQLLQPVRIPPVFHVLSVVAAVNLVSANSRDCVNLDSIFIFYYLLFI